MTNSLSWKERGETKISIGEREKAQTSSISDSPAEHEITVPCAKNTRETQKPPVISDVSA